MEDKQKEAKVESEESPKESAPAKESPPKSESKTDVKEVAGDAWAPFGSASVCRNLGRGAITLDGVESL